MNTYLILEGPIRNLNHSATSFPCNMTFLEKAVIRPYMDYQYLPVRMVPRALVCTCIYISPLFHLCSTLFSCMYVLSYVYAWVNSIVDKNWANFNARCFQMSKQLAS